MYSNRLNTVHMKSDHVTFWTFCPVFNGLIRWSDKVSVVNFDQRLGAAHCNHWLKYAFSALFCEKSWVEEEKARNLSKNLAKILTEHILSIVWSVQHTNAGQNMQQVKTFFKLLGQYHPKLGSKYGSQNKGVHGGRPPELGRIWKLPPPLESPHGVPWALCAASR